MKSLIDLLTYFARFPKHEALLRNFASTSNLVEGYQDLKTALSTQAELLPQITDYIISVSELALQDRLKNSNGFFLLLEYGALSYSPAPRATTGMFSLAITIGHSSKKGNNDLMAEALIMQQCLDLLMQIAKQIETDNEELFCGQTSFFDGQIDISPVEPALLYGNVGWTMSFKKRDNNW